MSLLYPLMALGALALGVPIWLHLRRRDEKNLVEFPTLRFLDDQPVAQSRPMWPRNWPLLLLRMLCLLLLVAAFTWPYHENEQTIIIEESRVYILDNTLSHQVGSRFSTAQDKLAEQIDAADISVQIGVIELGSTARVLARFGDENSAAAASVRKLSPSAERGDFVDAFRTAAEMLSTSLGAKRRIVLLSDSQTNQWLLDADTPPFLQNIEVEVLKVPDKSVDNLALSAPQARRSTRDGEAWVEVAVTVQSQGTHGPVDIVFRDRGQEVDRVSLQPVSDTAEAEAATTLGTAFAQWKTDSTNWTVAEITLEDNVDDLPGDNRVVFSIPPIREGKVDLIADSFFLRRALSPEVMKGRWNISVADQDDLLDRDEESGPDVLCLESHRLKSAEVRSLVRDALSAGRGVILFVDKITPVISGFLRDMGIEAEASQDEPGQPATFRYVYAEHPVFDPFRTAKYGNLAEVEFKNYRRLKVRDATSLAFSASGDPLMFEANAGPGRLLVFSFAFDRSDTNWPIHPTFIPFLDQALQYVRGKPATWTSYQPAESVVWELPAGVQAEQVVLSALDPATLGVAADAFEPLVVDVNERKATFALPPQVGHVAVRYDLAETLGAILDVNASPLESELRYESPPTVLAGWQRTADNDASETLASDEPTTISLSKMEALQQRNWWYLLTAAMALFMVETIWGLTAKHKQ